MIQESVEDYLAAIHRLRESPQTAVPLSALQAYFGFSRVSIHEMIQKLKRHAYLDYEPYHGVRLTERGEQVAQALLRRHRLWERFLTDLLAIPWDEAHEIAGQLEHAATEKVTERLAALLGNPEACPHGGPLDPGKDDQQGVRLPICEIGTHQRILRIAPETPTVLHYLQKHHLRPNDQLNVIKQRSQSTVVQIKGKELQIPHKIAHAIWTISITREPLEKSETVEAG